MSRFAKALADRQPDPSGRRWIYVPYDQLSSRIGPLLREDPDEIGIAMVESPWKAARRPYHVQKLALILANGRHFALEQAERGVAVQHVVGEGCFRDALAKVAAKHGPIRAMRPAERELRTDLAPLFDAGTLIELPHEGWMADDDDFTASQKPSPPWRMDAFYRHLRRRTGILMDGGKPVGGTYSFDAENRKPWKGEPPAPRPPVFDPDGITREVAELIHDRFPDHPGRIELTSLPATSDDAERIWAWALEECLHSFGPFEDAMSHESRGLFHTRISGLLNIHRLLPARVVADVAAADIPLASKEGFIRQILGWREFVYRVHERTDGFRDLPHGQAPIAATPGDGGWSRWSGRIWPRSVGATDPDGGALPSELGADRPLPLGFWPDRPTGLGCLDHVVEAVWNDAWTHHIPRLMVLANIATLLDVSPRELTDWFWIAYLDAFDWVVEPNVLAMGTFAVGELMTTKPYVSGAAYIDRMGDFCADCAFHPKRDCPITSLYWAFLDRHRDALSGNPRMRLILSALSKRSADRVLQDRAIFEWARAVLERGGRLEPDQIPEAKDV
jgi:deoxyribodipyrimidine photolyase-related protein